MPATKKTKAAPATKKAAAKKPAADKVTKEAVAAKKEAAPVKAKAAAPVGDRKALAAKARSLKLELLAIRFNVQSPSLNEYRKKRRELTATLAQLN